MRNRIATYRYACIQMTLLSVTRPKLTWLAFTIMLVKISQLKNLIFETATM